MTIKVFNTETRRIEPLTSQIEGKIGLYVCGPTVYDFSHIGHARTYIAFDVIVRYLRYRGYDVRYVVNITNVEDKIINRARETGVEPIALASEFGVDADEVGRAWQVATEEVLSTKEENDDGFYTSVLDAVKAALGPKLADS